MAGNFLIYPEIFGGETGKIRAFFTGIVPGADRSAICRLLGISDQALIMPIQRHTSDILAYSGKETETPACADAVITILDGVALGVKTADCVPVLLADEKTGAIGAVHAGWRGTAAAILPAAIAKMTALYGCRPEDMKLAIGPSIRGCCYEVGADVSGQVRAGVGGSADYFRMDENGLFPVHLDLAAANRSSALRAGVRAENIWVSEMCTCCHPERFNSYRRETRAGKVHSATAGGRQGGFIMKVSQG
ncbi:MAG: peptidoglycan editing factor PgeF [Nitrospiraceae bacterium]|nr:peptidoglycan editing factor PgeF [Nitrospiraceae bacterium]